MNEVKVMNAKGKKNSRHDEKNWTRWDTALSVLYTSIIYSVGMGFAEEILDLHRAPPEFYIGLFLASLALVIIVRKIRPAEKEHTLS